MSLEEPSSAHPLDAEEAPRHRLAQIAEWIWILAALIIPSAYDPLANQAFELPKLILTVGFGGISAALALVGIARGFHRPTDSTLRTLALMWLMAIALSTVASADRAESFWGSYERQSGLLLALALVGIGLGPWFFLRDGTQLRRLLVAVCLSSIPVIIYGLLQRAGLDWLGWLGRPLGVTSTIGSSTALGGYLALCAAITIAVAASSHGRLRLGPMHCSPRALAISLLILQLVTLLLTSVRASLAAAVLGMLVVVILLGAPQRLGIRSRALLALALVLVALGVFGLSVLRGASAQVDRGTLPRADTSLTERFDLWRSATRYLGHMLGTEPLRLLTGAGPDRQAELMEPWLEPRLTERLPTTRFDRAHLSLLDALMTTGLLGLATSLALLGVCLRRVAFQRPAPPLPIPAVNAGTAGAIVAFTIESSVSFPTVTTLALMALLIGASSLAGPVRLSDAAPSGRGSRIWSSIVIGVIATTAGIVMPLLVGHLAADRLHQRALAAAAGEKLSDAIALEANAADLAPHRVFYRLQRSEWMVQLAASAPRETNAKPVVLESDGQVQRLLEGARWLPQPASHPFVLAMLATATDALADATGEARRAELRTESLAFAQSAAQAAPLRAQFQDQAARAAHKAGQHQLALAFYAQAERLDPDQAHRVAEMGHVHASLGQEAAARALYEEALELDIRSAAAWWGIARLHLLHEAWAEALEPAQRAARLQMRDWVYRRDLGRIHRSLGETQFARQELRAAARLAPSWEWARLMEESESLADR